ncbi:MAG: L,D-transpeptidase [Thiothrix sp.]
MRTASVIVLGMAQNWEPFSPAGKNTGKLAEIITDPVDVPEDLSDNPHPVAGWLGAEEKQVAGGFAWPYIYIHGTPGEGLIGKPASMAASVCSAGCDQRVQASA